jgi:hypothetical protein
LTSKNTPLVWDLFLGDSHFGNGGDKTSNCEREDAGKMNSIFHPLGFRPSSIPELLLTVSGTQR